MALFHFLLVGICVVSQSAGELSEISDVRAGLGELIGYKLESLKNIGNEVESILKEVEGRELEVSPKSLGSNSADVPVVCLKVLSTEQPCPDAKTVLTQLKVVTTELMQLLTDGITAFNKSFGKDAESCTGTINPITAFRCFLRAFRQAYNSLNTLEAQALKLKNDAKTLYNEYIQYSTDCKTDQNNLEAMCKKIHAIKSE